MLTAMGTDRVTADAIYLLGRIKTFATDGALVSERDMHQACRSRFPKKTDILPPISRLVETGYLIQQEVSETTGGRPPSPLYRFDTQKTQKTPKRALVSHVSLLSTTDHQTSEMEKIKN
jgi:hypothetical protein